MHNAAAYHLYEHHRLQRTIAGCISAAFGATLLYSLLGIWLGAGAFATSCGVLLLARHLLQRGHVQAAVLTVCITALGLTLVSATQFFTVLSVAVLAIITVALALPYLPSHILMRLSVAAWLVS